jgi:hypothetical protein
VSDGQRLTRAQGFRASNVAASAPNRKTSRPGARKASAPLVRGMVAVWLWWGGVLMGAQGCAHVPSAFAGLPEQVCGWVAQKPDGLYDAKTLHSYIDGGAEVYLEFNVRRVLARRYVKEGAPEILADVFDMGSSEDAFGAYHHNLREGLCPGVGRESEYMTGALYFWKDRYFVSIMAYQETEDVKQTIVQLAKAVAAAIPEEGAPPEILRFLPKTGASSTQIHYFHGHVYLNVHYFISEDNLLGLGKDTEGLLAQYPAAGEGSPARYVLVLVRYPSKARAHAAYTAFLDGYMPDAKAERGARKPPGAGLSRLTSAPPIVQTENGKWTGALCDGDIVAVAFDVPSKTELQQVMGGAEALRAPR